MSDSFVVVEIEPHISEKARLVSGVLESWIPEAVNIILISYETMCEEVSKIEFRTETEGMRSRLAFECLCFSAYNCCLIAKQFITVRRFWRNRPDRKLINQFNKAIAGELVLTCETRGLTELREIVIVEMDKETLEPTFGEGDNLNPSNRLIEYLEAYKSEPGSEIEQFGKYIGKALDASHYPTLEFIGVNFSTVISGMVKEVMSLNFE